MPIVSYLKNLLSARSFSCVFDSTARKIILITCLYALGTYGLGMMIDHPVSISTVLYIRILKFTWWFFIIGFFIVRFCSVLFFHPHPRGFFIAFKDDLKFYIMSDRLIRGSLLIACCLVFFSLFTSTKSMISIVNPFSWDIFFINMDRTLHFGRLPSDILHDLFRSDAMTLILSVFYKVWFIAKFGIVFWVAFSKSDDQRREHFFIAMILSWIIVGTITAMIFSSAGPCFFHRLYPDLLNPYEGLMSYMRQAYVLGIQFESQAMSHLWGRHLDGGVSLFSGISAFPSMHVSLATLLMLVGWRTHKIAGILLTAYLLIILVGSVYLGWHYAVDGYSAIPLTMLIWWATGRFLVGKKKESLC